MQIVLNFYKRHTFFTLILLWFLLTIGLFTSSSGFYTYVYQTYLYKGIRYFLDQTMGAISINTFWPILLIVLAILGIQIFIWIKKHSEKGIHTKQLFRILSVLLLIINLFYWLWGFHYKGEDLTTHLMLTYKIPGEQRMIDEANSSLNALIELRKIMAIDSSQSITESGYPEPGDTLLYESARIVFKELRLPIYGKPAVKKLYPMGFLHRLNTVGFYNPITGEANVEADLQPLLFPFVKAHEWTHAQGITDEGDANFLAYWICVYSSDPYYQYSGHLTYWRYLMRDIRRNFPDLYDHLQSKLLTGIRKDLEEIRENLYKYPDFMPKARDAVYNSYLKTHGIAEGMDSYNRIVKMVIAYKRQKLI
jgi:hypothetical protein